MRSKTLLSQPGQGVVNMGATLGLGNGFLHIKDLQKLFALRGGFIDSLLGRTQSVVRAVDGVDLTVSPGEILGLVGESGSGKTTLGRLVAMLDRPTSGSIEFRERDIAQLSRAEVWQLRRDIQMIFQNPYESVDPRYTIAGWLAEPLRLLRITSASEYRDRILEVLSQVELRPAESFLDRYPHELSGGQRQRVCIARAAIVKPKLMIADEPVSMLDVSVRSGLMKLMLDMRNELGMAFIYITHDLAVARYMSDRIAVMYLGKIVELGPVDEVIEKPAHPYTKILMSAVPEPRPGRSRRRANLKGEAASIKEIPGGCRFHPRCPMVQPKCEEEEPPFVTVDKDRESACHFSAQLLNGAM